MMEQKTKAELLKEYNLASGRIRDLNARLDDMKERNERAERRIVELLKTVDEIREKDRSEERLLRENRDKAVSCMAQQRIEIDKKDDLIKLLKTCLKELL